MLITIMLLLTIALAAAANLYTAFALTPSDLPECAIECYVNGVHEMRIDLNDYEGQCPSAPFQLFMRGCTAINCDYDKYFFVFEF